MPKNTFIFVSILAVFAAIVASVNIANYYNPRNNQIPQENISNVTPTPKIELTSYTACGMSFSYPDNLTKLDVGTGGVMLINTDDPHDSIAIICQDDIPKPALAQTNIENIEVSSVSAALFHDSTPKEGSPSDKLIFTHPTSKLDVMISGFGSSFDVLIKTLKLL
ncbi:hypothetical protein ACFL1A_02940 [Patescibacteria group bacterium]